MSDKDLIINLIEKVDDLKTTMYEGHVSHASELSNIHQILVKQESNLDRHMERTDLAEQRLDNFEKLVLPIVEKVKFTKWLWAIICGLCGALVTVVGLILKF